MTKTNTRVDRRGFFVAAGSTASAGGGFPHICAGRDCAICKWVKGIPIWLGVAKVLHENEAKTLDSGKEIAENEATRTSAQTLNRA